MLIGTSIEELIRHHPLLRTSVFAAIKATLARIEEMGKAYDPPENIKSWYRLSLQPASSVSVGAAADADVSMEFDNGAPSQPSGPIPPEGEPNSSADTFGWLRDDAGPRVHDNLIISFIDVFCKVN